MEQLLKLLEISFDAGVGAGIIEAAHVSNMMKDTKERTFSEFIDDPNVKYLVENLANKIK